MAQSANSKSFQIEYGASSWNKNSKTIDQAFMFVRDKDTGKVAKVRVQETEPDSSVFNGKFAIDWAGTKAQGLQFYVPNQKMRDDNNAVKEFNGMLSSGDLSPALILLSESEKSYRIDVYDTKDQLETAINIKKKSDQVKAKAEKTKLTKPVATEGQLEAAKMAERAKVILAMAAAEAARQTERLRQSQLEEQKRTEEKRKAASASAAERIRRGQEASRLAAQGQEAYQAGNFKSAESFFRRASETDPLNDSFYFMYGVTLYRNEKFNDALVTLRLAKTDAQTEIEKFYYMGLIHYRLQELDPAIEKFRSVRTSNSKVLSPSAAFYEGICHFSKEKWSDAQESFEWVLDNSDDANLDEKAEQYLEKVADMIQMQKIMNAKWKITAGGGLNYDSNVLYTPDNDTATSTASDAGGLRALLQGDITRKLFHKKESDFSARLNTLYMYSFDDQFSRADPWQTGLGAIYNYRGTTLSQKTYQYALKPGVETLYMDAENTGSREDILGSVVLKNELTIVKRDDYFVAYGIELRLDNSKLDITNGDDNADAFKYSVDTTHTTFLDASKKKALIGKVGYVANDAKGSNRNFNRIEVTGTYAAPLDQWKNTMWTAGLALQFLNYPEADEKRRDTNITASGSVARVLNESWSVAGTGSYTLNTSNLDANDYSRYSLMGLANYTWSGE